MLGNQTTNHQPASQRGMQLAAPARGHHGLSAVHVHPYTLGIRIHVAADHLVPDAEAHVTQRASLEAIELCLVGHRPLRNLPLHQPLASHHRSHRLLRNAGAGDNQARKLSLRADRRAVRHAFRRRRLPGVQLRLSRRRLSCLHLRLVPRTLQGAGCAERDRPFPHAVLNLAVSAAEVVTSRPLPHSPTCRPHMRCLHRISAPCTHTHQL
mmetsp:Transcript_60800/g.125243  ORF Transcript_60800/g.125243 Transcript_60800/m.125243 type:complete len:210 (-) Transcript_60800:2017-2646(-)